MLDRLSWVGIGMFVGIVVVSMVSFFVPKVMALVLVSIGVGSVLYGLMCLFDYEVDRIFNAKPKERP